MTSIKWRSVQSVADELGVSDVHVYKLINEGKLKAYRPSPRTTRIYQEDLDAFIAGSVIQTESSDAEA